MFKKFTVLCLMASLLVLVGCASVQTAQKLNDQKLTTGSEQSITNINVNNWGFFIFYLPIASGDLENIGSVKWFRDTLSSESVIEVATKKAKDMGATKSVDMVSMVTPVYFIFGVKQVQVSLNAVK